MCVKIIFLISIPNYNTLFTIYNHLIPFRDYDKILFNKLFVQIFYSIATTPLQLKYNSRNNNSRVSITISSLLLF